MPGTFTAAIITAGTAGLLLGVWLVLHGSSDDGMAFAGQIAAGAASVLTGITVLLVIASSWTVVSTQDIGIITSFGRPSGHLSAGLHFIAPWDSVTEMDEAVQITDYSGGGCLTVRIADQQTACANVTIRWRIQPSAADELFRNYRNSTAGVQDGLVGPELQNTANTVFGAYDPVSLLASTIPLGHPGNPTVPQLGQQVEQDLATRIGSDVDIVSLFIPNIIYDQTVQGRLNAVLTQSADTLVADQAEQTASAQAAANKILAGSVDNDPDVLVSKCLDLLSQMLKQDMTPPAGFSCWPGGSGTGVIANASG